MLSLIIVLLGCLVGFAFGIGLTAFLVHRRRKEAIGTLQIIESDGEAPYLFLSLDTEIESFVHEPTVTMNIIRKKTSHK